MAGSSIFDKRAAIDVLLDILTIFSRSDLKSELIKELDRHTKVLTQLVNSQSVDAENCRKYWRNSISPAEIFTAPTEKLAFASWKAICFKAFPSVIPSLAVVVPSIYRLFTIGWNRTKPNNKKILNAGLNPLRDIRTAIDLILGFIRKSTTPTRKRRKPVFFSWRWIKAIRCNYCGSASPPNRRCFAEISGGKHRFSIRFMKPSSDENRPGQTIEDIAF